MELTYLFIFGMEFSGHGVVLFIYIWDGVPWAGLALYSTERMNVSYFVYIFVMDLP